MRRPISGSACVVLRTADPVKFHRTAARNATGYLHFRRTSYHPAFGEEDPVIGGKRCLQTDANAPRWSSNKGMGQLLNAKLLRGNDAWFLFSGSVARGASPRFEELREFDRRRVHYVAKFLRIPVDVRLYAKSAAVRPGALLEIGPANDLVALRGVSESGKPAQEPLNAISLHLLPSPPIPSRQFSARGKVASDELKPVLGWERAGIRHGRQTLMHKFSPGVCLSTGLAVRQVKRQYFLAHTMSSSQQSTQLGEKSVRCRTQGAGATTTPNRCDCRAAHSVDGVGAPPARAAVHYAVVGRSRGRHGRVGHLAVGADLSLLRRCFVRCRYRGENRGMPWAGEKEHREEQKQPRAAGVRWVPEPFKNADTAIRQRLASDPPSRALLQQRPCLVPAWELGSNARSHAFRAPGKLGPVVEPRVLMILFPLLPRPVTRAWATARRMERCEAATTTGGVSPAVGSAELNAEGPSTARRDLAPNYRPRPTPPRAECRNGPFPSPCSWAPAAAPACRAFQGREARQGGRHEHCEAGPQAGVFPPRRGVRAGQRENQRAWGVRSSLLAIAGWTTHLPRSLRSTVVTVAEVRTTKQPLLCRTLAVFGEQRDGRSTSQLRLSSRSVPFDRQGDDELLHFYWKDVASDVTEDDYVVFPDDAVLERVPLANQRVFVLLFKSSCERILFWMQEPKADQDDEILARINVLINRPLTADEVSAPISQMTQNQSVAPINISAAVPWNSAPSGPVSDQQLQQLRNILSGIQVPTGTGMLLWLFQGQWPCHGSLRRSCCCVSKRTGAEAEALNLSRVVTPQVVVPLLDDPKVCEGAKSLFPHLPDSSPRSRQEIEDIVRSPQFQQVCGTS
ncbi:MAG: hypothetical protein BJ554DRAFT_1365 [Olpidium bornovanus]|uniref:Pru domain-containing protein n=1 Tax=Olpidium bornovanus TaxID=278681 RepID=A0A8H7ZSE2_9FUNG|nr:MAG: hypothetical protein BJ554DRAFT_1365 [Olpidium bornovanus]